MDTQRNIQIGQGGLLILLKAFSNKGTKAAVARACGVTANAAGFWFKDPNGSVPRVRLKLAALRLHEEIQHVASPSPEQLKARELLERHLGVKLSELATEHSQRIKKMEDTGRIKYVRGPAASQGVENLSTEALAEEISKRGWTVTLRRIEGNRGGNTS